MQHAPYPDVPPDFGHWLAGFIDGEGSFYINRVSASRKRSSYACRFTLQLRNDDRCILERIAATTQIGYVRDRQRRADRGWRDHPCAMWRCDSQSDCWALARLLDRYPLRAKKARDYAIWREALTEWCSVVAPAGGEARRRYVARDWSRMATLADALKQAHVYIDPHLPIPPEVGVLDPVAAEDQLVLREGVAPGEMP